MTEKAKEKEKKKTNKARLDIGLRPILSGERSCLKCDKKFISEDLTNQKMCSSCRLNLD